MLDNTSWMYGILRDNRRGLDVMLLTGNVMGNQCNDETAVSQSITVKCQKVCYVTLKNISALDASSKRNLTQKWWHEKSRLRNTVRKIPFISFLQKSNMA